jgi:hypothetical protein
MRYSLPNPQSVCLRSVLQELRVEGGVFDSVLELNVFTLSMVPCWVDLAVGSVGYLSFGLSF